MDPTRLVYVIESSFPTPIAAAFAWMRHEEENGRDVQRPAAVLEATAAHLGIVAACDALSTKPRRNGRELADLLSFVRAETELSGFRRPVGVGNWARLCELSLRAIGAEGRDPVWRGLDAWFRYDGQRLLARAITTRNRIHDGRADYDEVRRHVTELLISLCDLPGGTYLVQLGSLALSHGVRRGQIRLFEGVHSTATSLELSEEVPTGVYVVTPGRGEMLSLDPFYEQRRCEDCSGDHLFRLQALQRGKGEFRAIDATHTAKLADVRAAVQALIEGTEGRRRLTLRHVALEWSPETRGLCPGAVVAGRYRIGELLGKGGMGEVYAADDLTSGAAVALKLLPYALLRDRTLIERFRQEAAKAARFAHPSIARVLDWGDSAGDHYLVMERAQGWGGEVDGRRPLDLSGIAKPLPAGDVVRIGRQVLDALHYLHGQRIVHRDVKPQNILLFEDGSVKLTDFGIAWSAENGSLTLTGQFLGTPEYISPEQAEGIADLDGRSDVYSFGIVLYELLTGCVPYQAATPLATALMHKDPAAKRAALPEDCPAALRLAVDTALQKDRSARFRTALEFYEALDRPGVGPRRTRPWKRWAAWLALLAAVGAVGVAQLVARWAFATGSTAAIVGSTAALCATALVTTWAACRAAPDRQAAGLIMLTVFVLFGGLAMAGIGTDGHLVPNAVKVATALFGAAGAFASLSGIVLPFAVWGRRRGGRPTGPEAATPREATPPREPGGARFGTVAVRTVSLGRLPRDVDAVVFEEDTFLVMSTEPALEWNHEHPVRTINEARDVETEPLGTVIVRGGAPLRLLAVVHDLGAETICRESDVRAALERVASIASQRRLRTVALPLLGVAHGRLDPARVVELTRAAFSGVSVHPDAIWIIVAREAEAQVRGLLGAEAASE